MEQDFEVKFVYTHNNRDAVAVGKTDSHGNFEIDDVPVDAKGTVEFVKNGYSAAAENIVVGKDGVTDLRLVTGKTVSLNNFT